MAQSKTDRTGAKARELKRNMKYETVYLRLSPKQKASLRGVAKSNMLSVTALLRHVVKTLCSGKLEVDFNVPDKQTDDK